MMRIRSEAAAAPLALLLAGAALAGPPNGPYAVEVGDANGVSFLSGDNEECDGDSSLSLCIVTSVATDATGVVSGTGSFNFTGFIAGDLPMTLDGHMAGSTSKPIAKVVVAFSGPATLTSDGSMFLGEASGGGKLTCKRSLPADEFFSCAGRLKLCFAAMGHRVCKGGGGFVMEVRGASGSWLLGLDLATSDTGAVTGNATATLANAAAETFAVTGKYNAKRDQSTLKLKSLEPPSKDKASFGNLAVTTDSVTSGKLKFTIAGEKGTETILSPPILPTP